MMHKISRETAKVAELPLKMNLQLFGDDEDEGYPELENDPEFKEDAKEFSKMDAKMDKFIEEKTPKVEVKEVKKEIEPVKEEVKAVTEDVATPEQKPKQDKETNDAFQNMRKQLEAQEAKAKKADELIAAQFGSQGITTVEQYDAWIREGEEQAEVERLTNAGLTPEEIQKLKDYDRIQAETSQEAQVKQKEAVQSQWKQLYSAYPDIVEASKAFDEGKDPEWYTDEMKAEIARGASPIAAYRHAHFDTILANATKTVKETATQDALDKLNSKDHLAPNASTGGEVDHVEIDPETMRMFKQLNKGKTDAQIRAFYKKSLAGG